MPSTSATGGGAGSPRLTRSARGGALVLVMLVLLLFTLLGTAAVQMGAYEIEQSGLQAAQQEAGDLAESGIELAIGWFARPETFAGRIGPPTGPCPAPTQADTVLAKRCRRRNGRPSFSTDGGESQFQGSLSQPDGAITVHAVELFSQLAGSPGSVDPARGGMIDVTLFGPTTPGAICTLQSTGRTAGGTGRTIRVELYEAAAPVLTAAAAAGAAGPAVGPVRLHWGGLRYDAAGRLPSDPDQVPFLTLLASVDGRPYAGPDGVYGRLDRWMDVVIGGRLLEPVGEATASLAFLQQWAGRSNVRIGATAPTDGDSWPYWELKRSARRFGRYYATDQQGRLYRDGRPPSIDADAALGVVDEPAVVSFIDTIDGQPPRLGPDGNLATIRLSHSVGRHSVYIGGHLILAPSDSPLDLMAAAPLVVPSPLADGGPVELEGVAFNGGFFVAGRLTVERESRLYGAIYAADGFEGTDRLEVWYDRRLGDAGWPGWPVVSILPGSWRVISQ